MKNNINFNKLYFLVSENKIKWFGSLECITLCVTEHVKHPYYLNITRDDTCYHVTKMQPERKPVIFTYSTQDPEFNVIQDINFSCYRFMLATFF